AGLDGAAGLRGAPPDEDGSRLRRGGQPVRGAAPRAPGTLRDLRAPEDRLRPGPGVRELDRGVRDVLLRAHPGAQPDHPAARLLFRARLVASSPAPARLRPAAARGGGAGHPPRTPPARPPEAALRCTLRDVRRFLSMPLSPAERQDRIDRYGRGFARLKAALARVPEEARKWRPGPKKWSVHEVVCHCADSELN